MLLEFSCLLSCHSGYNLIFCPVTLYPLSLQFQRRFGHFSFHVRVAHDICVSKTCQLRECMKWNLSTLCRALIAVCSALVEGGLLKSESVCVCLRGADEKDLITRYSVLFYLCWEGVQPFHLWRKLLDLFSSHH